jgi:hypothetical protein
MSRFIVEYSNLRDFGPYVIGIFFTWGFLKDCVENWDYLHIYNISKDFGFL